jgi:peptide/nickel transport system substrate-binding protein
MNWFQPLDLMLNSGHTFWFMDFKEGGVAKFAEFDDQLAEVTNLTAPGDFAALEQRADAAWTKRQQIISQENNDWGKSMQLEPTFKTQWDAIATRFNEAADDAAKLSAYQDALSLVLNEERALTQYDFYTEENKEAQRLMATLSTKTLEDAWDTVVPLQQLTVDAAWMVPIYNDKVFYVTAPQLSGIVLNKLSWGGTFQYQYLNWEE